MRCDKCGGTGHLSPPLMRFELVDPIVPYVHRTTRGKYSERAQRYHASQNAIRWRLRNQMQLNGWRIFPAGTPLAFYLEVTRPDIFVPDATNLQKAVEDACNTTVFVDDCYNVDVRAVTLRGPEHRATLDIRTV